jgi:hypothetical protein
MRDSPEMQHPPRVVVIAISLFMLSHALNDLRRIAEVGILPVVSHPIALAMVWGPVLWLSVASYRGKNWGRLFIAGFTVFGVCYMPWSLPPVMGTRMAALQCAQAILCIGASLLLFRPAAGRWFRSLKKASATVEQ